MGIKPEAPGSRRALQNLLLLREREEFPEGREEGTRLRDGRMEL